MSSSSTTNHEEHVGHMMFGDSDSDINQQVSGQQLEPPHVDCCEDSIGCSLGDCGIIFYLVSNENRSFDKLNFTEIQYFSKRLSYPSISSLFRPPILS